MNWWHALWVNLATRASERADRRTLLGEPLLDAIRALSYQSALRP